MDLQPLLADQEALLKKHVKALLLDEVSLILPEAIKLGVAALPAGWQTGAIALESLLEPQISKALSDLVNAKLA